MSKLTVTSQSDVGGTVRGNPAAQDAPTSIGDSLKAARRSEGLTQVQLAELAGLSDRTIRDLERGSTSPSLKALVVACDVLGLTIEVRR